MKSALRISLVVCLLAQLSCKKKDDKSTESADTNSTTTTGNTAPAESASSTPFVRFTVDGNTVTHTHGVSGVQNGVSQSKQLATNTSTNPSKASYGTSFSTSSKGLFSFNKGTISFTGTEPSGADFKAFYGVGDHSYSTNAIQPNGVVITYFDASGNSWSTDKGTKDQTGSTFKIEEIKETMLANQVISFMASFSCKVYDSNGNSKTLTGGKLVGAVEND